MIPAPKNGLTGPDYTTIGEVIKKVLFFLRKASLYIHHKDCNESNTLTIFSREFSFAGTAVIILGYIILTRSSIQTRL